MDTNGKMEERGWDMKEVRSGEEVEMEDDMKNKRGRGEKMRERGGHEG